MCIRDRYLNIDIYIFYGTQYVRISRKDDKFWVDAQEPSGPEVIIYTGNDNIGFRSLKNVQKWLHDNKYTLVPAARSTRYMIYLHSNGFSDVRTGSTGH